MAEGKLRRLTENENQDCTAEPPNKKRRKENKKVIFKNFIFNFNYLFYFFFFFLFINKLYIFHRK